jgi:hypothetical protein
MIHETLYGSAHSNEGPKSQFYQFYAALNNVFNAFFVIYLPEINASMEESINDIERNDALTHYLPCTVDGQLFRAFYDLFS